MPEHSPHTAGLGCRLHSAPNLSDLHVVRPKLPKPPTDPLGAVFGHPQASPPQPSHGLPSCRPLRGSPKLPDFLQRNPLPPILGSPTKVTVPVSTWVHAWTREGGSVLRIDPLPPTCSAVGHGGQEMQRLADRSSMALPALSAQTFCAGWQLAP